MSDREPDQKANDKPYFGIIYRNAWVYKLAMRLLYRSTYRKKYELVAEQIPAGSTVVDLCCGDCQIYPFLKAKGCQYIGLDINSRFVEWNRKNGIDVRLWDGTAMDIPEADVVCIQSAFYHFIPNEKKLLERMLARARKRVIVAEPVNTWSQIGFPLLHKIAINLTKVHGRAFDKRFSESEFNAVFADLPAERVTRIRLPRELIVVVEK